MRAAPTTWDAGSTTDAQWSNVLNWSGDLEPTSVDDVLFPYVVPGSLGNPSLILLGSSEIAQSLRFSNNYTLAMLDPNTLLGDLTISSGNVMVDLGSTATIGAKLTQSSGLTLGNSTYGRGALRLSNAANSYTGATTINSGSLIINSSGALGGSTSTVVVNGSSIPGSGGGALVLDGVNGSTLTGFTLNRSLSLAGGGPSNDGAALVNIGNNSISGGVTFGASANSRIVSSIGMLSLGDVDVGTGPTTRVTSIAGYGNVTISGVLSGNAMIDRLGGANGTGTLILKPSDASDFMGPIRISGGSVRIGSGTNFGNTFGINASSTFIINSGTLEVRTEASSPGNRADIGINIYLQALNGSTVFVDREIGGAGLNAAVEFGTLSYIHNLVTTFTGRNGYSVEFAASKNAFASGGLRSILINNLNGLFVINGDHWDGTGAVSSNYFQTYGSGDMLITGSLTLTGVGHYLDKSGQGKVTILGTNSQFTGETRLGGGTLAITNFASINNASGSGPINFNAGVSLLEIIGHNQASDFTTEKGIGLVSNAKIAASQTGTSGPVVFSATPVVTGTTAKTLYLGGTNTLENTFSGVIGDVTTLVTSLAKTDAGTWLISGNNTYTGTTTVSGGTLKVLANAATSTVVSNASNIIFAVNGFSGDQTAGGTLEFVNRTGLLSLETLGQLIPTAGAGTVKLTSTSGTANLQFAGVGLRAGGATLNFNAANGIVSLTSFTQPGNGLYDARAYATFNGVNWAAVNGSSQVVAAANDGALPASGGSSTANYVDIRTTITTDASPGTVVGTLKLAAPSGGQTLALGGQLTLMSGGLLFDNSLGSATITGGTISTPSASYDLTTTAGSATVNLASGTTAGMYVGMAFTGNARIPVGATVASIATNGTQFTLSSGTGVAAGTAVATTFANELVFVVNGSNAANALTINSLIDASNGGLTKAGTGTLVLGAANAYLGNTTINEGIVRLEGVGKLGAVAASSVTTIRQAGFLDLNGVSTATGYLSGAGAISNGSATAATLTIGISTSAAAGVFSGTIQDGGGQLGIVLNGTSAAATVQSLFGLNTYSGPTVLNGGTLQVNVLDLQRITSLESTTTAGSTIIAVASTAGLVVGTPVSGSGIFPGSTIERILSGTTFVISKAASTSGFVTLGFTPFSSIGTSSNAASNLIFNGGVLQYTGTTATYVQSTQTRSVSIDRLFTLAGNGTITSQGTYGNAAFTATANNATLIFNNVGTIAFLGIGARTLTLNGNSTGDNEIALKLVDNGIGSPLSVTKDGTGQWVLSNAGSTYTGATTITGGVLVAEASVIPDTSPIVLNGGVLQTSGTFTRSLTATVAAGIGTISWGANVAGGFAASIDKLVISIGGNATPSTLVWNGGAGFLNGTSGVLLLGSSTALAEIEIVNSIDLGATKATTRSINVIDNTSTFTDFATISGAIVGGGNISKVTGTGVLQLLGANTYDGSTTVSAGTLVVTKLGNTSEGMNGSSSVGSTSDAAAVTSAVILGANTNLVYIGSGEVSNRFIQLPVGTANLFADGSGPLTLTNVQFVLNGARTVSLRGSNSQGNKITNDLGDVGGVTSVTHDTPSTWILSGNNTYSGTTTLTAGMFGLGSGTVLNGAAITSGPIGKGSLSMTNATLFAYGGARTINNNLLITTAAAFVGDYGITLNGTLTGGSTTITITNSIVPTANLTFVASTYATNYIFNGSGSTIFNPALTGANTLVYSGTGSLTLGSTNTNSGAITVSSGTLKIGASNIIVDANTFNFTPAFGSTAALDLNGFSEAVNAFVTTLSFGSSSIDNSSATASVLTFGSATATTNSIGLTTTGAGTLSINKVGSAAYTFAKGPFSYSGSTTVAAGSLIFFADVSRTTAINVSGNGSLYLYGGFSAVSTTTSMNIAGGSTVSFVNYAGQPLAQLTSLILGTDSQTTTLQLDVGSVSDTLRLTSLGTATTAGSIVFNLQPVAGFGDAAFVYNGTTSLNGYDSATSAFYYTLLYSPLGGLNGATYSLGTLYSLSTPTGIVPGSASISASSTSVRLKVDATPAGTLYWDTTSDTIWSALGSWTTLTDRSIPATGTPGINNKVVFDFATVTTALATTLNGNLTIQALEFTGARPITVAVGTGGQLTIAPPVQSGNVPGVGINVAVGAGKPTISAGLILATDQSWNVADAGQTLDVSAIGGTGTLTKTGAGTLKINVAALTTPSIPALIINGGTVEMAAAGYLGTNAAGNSVPITINAGGKYQVNNNTAGGDPHVVDNQITLNGGTLAGGGKAKQYTGRITVSADSTISLTNIGPTPTGTPYQFQLLNVVNGPGKITVEGISETTNGNQISGILVLGASTNGNPDWSGGLQLNGGSVYFRNLTAQGTGPITASYGRLVFDGGLAGTVSDISQTITVDSAAPESYLEIAVDNATAAATDVYTVVLAKIVLGGSGAFPYLRLYQADAFSRISIGDIELKKDARIDLASASTLALGATPTLVVSGSIGSVTGNHRLYVNTDTNWLQTAYQTLRFSGTNTFTGGLALGAGVLEFGEDANLGAPTGDVSFGGGTLRFLSETTTTSVSMTRPIKVFSMPADIDGTLEISPEHRLTLSGTIEGSLSEKLVKTGTGTLVVTNPASPYTGLLSIAQGKLVGEGAIAGLVSIAAGATLSPGVDDTQTADGLGEFEVGSLALASGSTFVFEFSHAYQDGPGHDSLAGIEWDLVRINSTLTLDGTIKLQVENVGNDFDLSGGASWLFAEFAAGTDGNIRGVNALPIADTAVDSYFRIDATGVEGFPLAGSFYITTLDNGLYLNYSAVPEPSSLALISIAGLGMAAYRRRKRRHIEATDAALLSAASH